MSRFFVEGSDSEDNYEEEEASNNDKNESDNNEQVNYEKIDSYFEQIENELEDFSNIINSDSSFDDKMQLISEIENSINEYKQTIQNSKVNLPENVIEKMISIKQKLFSKTKEENFSQILDQYNQKVCSKFTQEIDKHCKNQNTANSEKDNGWFVSSDDDEAEKIKKKVRIETRKVKHVNFFTGKVVYEDDEEEEKIDDSIAKRDLDKFIASRQNGQITATTKRLNELLHATTDPKLIQLINNEIVLTVSQLHVDKAIENNDWIYALDSIASYSSIPDHLYPLFDRLNCDYWARTIDLRYLFIPSTAQLHEIFPRFLDLLKDFLTKISFEGFPEVYIRTADILIEHIYTDVNKQEDLIYFSTTILQALSNLNLNNEIYTTAHFGFTSLSYDAENIRARACLFLCYSLASTNNPSDAFQLFKQIPYINTNFRHTRVLCNRTRAQIGIFAFKQRNYKISYEMLRQFVVIKSIARNIGQEPKPVFPAWVMLDTQKVAYMNLYAAVILDLPALAISKLSMNDNDNDNDIPLSVHPKMHRDFLKDPIAHPETPIEKAVATASFAKNGEWKKAFEIAKENIDDNLHDNFLDDLKAVSLCCFLLNASDFYESLTFEFLAQMFEMEESKVKDIFTKMCQNKSPVEDVPIVFKSPKVIDDKYIQFE